MAPIKSTQVVQSSDAEVLTLNGIAPLTTEIRMSRQVVVMQEPSLVLKLKAHQIHNLLRELVSDSFYDDKGKPYIQLLIGELQTFVDQPYPEIQEPETIFED